MMDFRYFVLMPSGVSQIRSTLKDACADAIFDIKNGYGKLFAIYKIDPATARVVYLGAVGKKDTTYKFIIDGASSKYGHVLNRDGSFRKTPESKSSLR